MNKNNASLSLPFDFGDNQVDVFYQALGFDIDNKVMSTDVMVVVYCPINNGKLNFKPHIEITDTFAASHRQIELQGQTIKTDFTEHEQIDIVDPTGVNISVGKLSNNVSNAISRHPEKNANCRYYFQMNYDGDLKKIDDFYKILGVESFDGVYYLHHLPIDYMPFLGFDETVIVENNRFFLCITLDEGKDIYRLKNLLEKAGGNMSINDSGFCFCSSWGTFLRISDPAGLPVHVRVKYKNKRQKTLSKLRYFSWLLKD